MKKRKLVFAAALFLISCREADGPLGGTQGTLFVSSDPEGAHIYIDNTDTGLRTPDTVHTSGSHDVAAILDTLNGRYTYVAHANIQGIEPFNVSGPVIARCVDSQGADVGGCYSRNRIPVTAGNMQISMNVTGGMMLEDGNGQGIVWPAGSGDSYVSNAMPLIAAKISGHAVALGMYDVPTLAGRPALSIVNSNGGLQTDQKTWVLPVSTSTTQNTIRGIEIREQAYIDPSVPDVALIRITYRNITNSPLYQKLDPRGTSLGTEGLTFDDVYIGFGMDPDIGTATDDVMTYDPDLHAVFAYDTNFFDTAMSTLTENSPALVGLRMLSVPNNGNIILNGYGNTAGSQGDWHASGVDELLGWGIMSGTAAYSPDDPDPGIGTAVTTDTDVRMLVSAGPYSLRPAEELSIVVAVALAAPVPGTFTSTVAMPPGNPHDPNRPIMITAGALRKKLTDAAALLTHFPD
jgi:hypothetical protein